MTTRDAELAGPDGNPICQTRQNAMPFWPSPFWPSPPEDANPRRRADRTRRQPKTATRYAKQDITLCHFGLVHFGLVHLCHLCHLCRGGLPQKKRRRPENTTELHHTQKIYVFNNNLQIPSKMN